MGYSPMIFVVFGYVYRHSDCCERWNAPNLMPISPLYIVPVTEIGISIWNIISGRSLNLLKVDLFSFCTV